MREDPLVLINIEKWSDLEKVLVKDWPNSIQMEILDIHRKWNSLQIEHNLKVYCAYGDISNGMIAINEKVSLYEMTVLCPKQDTSDLEEALRTTKHINWDEEVNLAFATENIVECFKRIIEDVNTKIISENGGQLFVIKQGSSKFCYKLPSDLSFGPIQLEKAEFINSVWPHRYTNSTTYFVDFIRANMGYGLYKDQNLIGWVFIRENGPLLHLYVIDEHRRKGYGSLILKYITNVLLDMNKHCFAYCVLGNENASAMYRKLNFTYEGLVKFCQFRR